MKTIQEMREYSFSYCNSLPKYIEEHCRRVGLYSKIVAADMRDKLRRAYPGIREHEILNAVQLGGFYHDIGKAVYPTDLLNGEKMLTTAEKVALKSHPLRSAELINAEKDFQGEGEAFKKIILDCCLYHHERYDGKGYPKGLIGRFIPLAAQIVALCNFFDIMTYTRDINKKNDLNNALEAIANENKRMFSSEVTRGFDRSHKELGTAYYYMQAENNQSIISGRADCERESIKGS